MVLQYADDVTVYVNDGDQFDVTFTSNTISYIFINTPPPKNKLNFSFIQLSWFNWDQESKEKLCQAAKT